MLLMLSGPLERQTNRQSRATTGAKAVKQKRGNRDPALSRSKGICKVKKVPKIKLKLG